MDPVTALILSLTNLAISALQQATALHQRQANGETITEADLQAERARTQTLLAQGDALRSTPRQP